MPRKRTLPPPDQAVAFSPLFRLSPEVRNIVYTYVLVDSDSYHSLFIPTDFFKRRKKEPAYRCTTCRLTFDYFCHFSEHQSNYRNGDCCKPPAHNFPAISTTLLCCCRLINTEAAALLYRANTFYFDDPYTLQQFRLNTAMYSEHSAWLEEVTLQLSDSHAGAKAIDLWQQYVTGLGLGFKSARLSKHFPHLKRLTIVLAGRCLLYETKQLQSICDAFGQNFRGLDWVHIVGLNNEDVISPLRSMVCQSHSQESKNGPDDLALAELETVQTHVTEYESDWRSKAESEKSLMTNHLEIRTLQMEQNKRLLQMAEQQANHRPKDVALQQELGDLRINILSRKLHPPAIAAFGLDYITSIRPLLDYQLQLMLLEQQNKFRLLRDRRLEQEDKLRFLEIWARYTSDSRFGIAQDISQTEGLIRRFQVGIEDAAVPSNSFNSAALLLKRNIS
ncbi:MAG: hypothetical protein Q9200_002528 [Gallowayella weberi]